jgi:p24 family protein beta-1
MFLKLRLHQTPWRLKVGLSPIYLRYQNTNNTSPVRQLSELLAQVKDEQSYIVVRERTHRNTAESTNGRVKWWSMFQMGVLIGEGIFQVWWLKRFFEVGKNSAERFGVLSR